MADATPHAPAAAAGGKPAVSKARGPGRSARLASGVKRGTARLVALYARVRTTALDLEPARLEAGVQCRRPRAVSLALLLFVAGMTLDDLRVLRFPAYLVGAGLAVVVMAFGPLAMGRGLALRHHGEALGEFQARTGRLRRLDLLGMLVVALGVLAWLTVFSAGVPPWAR